MFSYLFNWHNFISLHFLKKKKNIIFKNTDFIILALKDLVLLSSKLDD